MKADKRAGGVEYQYFIMNVDLYNRQTTNEKIIPFYEQEAKKKVMLTDKAPELLEGIVEVDETYIGGSLKNIHAKKKKLKGLDNKTMVFGAIQRQGKVRVKVIPRSAC